MNICLDNLRVWAKKNNLFKIDFVFSDEFGFDRFNNIILLGTTAHPEIEPYINQFFYEYGCNYIDFWYPILAVLHELGHSATNNEFDELELLVCAFQKDDTWEKDRLEYWHIPDEFSANIWAINFINTHIDAVEELAQILIDGYNRKEFD